MTALLMLFWLFLPAVAHSAEVGDLQGRAAIPPQGARPQPARPQAPADTYFVSTLSPAEIQNKQAVIETPMGTIVLDLLADAAPNHVAHFITRAREGAYDGTIFHRVIPNGIIQGGDPLSKDPAQSARYGTGGMRELRFERNTEQMSRGAVAATLAPGMPDSGGTQFFICIFDQLPLTGQYTVFARVAEGLNVAQKISQVEADNTVPKQRVVMTKVTIRDKPPAGPEPFTTETAGELSTYRAVLETSMGNITFQFFPDKAPNHVRNFLRLASVGFYDGTAFREDSCRRGASRSTSRRIATCGRWRRSSTTSSTTRAPSRSRTATIPPAATPPSSSCWHGRRCLTASTRRLARSSTGWMSWRRSSRYR